MGLGGCRMIVKDLNEKILDLRVGLEPTTSAILERRLNQLGHRGSYDSSLGFLILRSQILLRTHSFKMVLICGIFRFNTITTSDSANHFRRDTALSGHPVASAV